MKTDAAEYLKTHAPVRWRFRDESIAQYHELLAGDGTLSMRALQKLQQSMREYRLVYGDRPIGISLRPHFLQRCQFKLLATTAEAVAAAFEKVATAAVQSPTLMTELGLTEPEQKLARIDPGFQGAAITSRIDGFVRGDQIRFVEYNAENPSSLSDQEGINRVLAELSAMSIFASRYHLQQFSPTQKLLDTLLAIYREWGGAHLPNIAIVDWKDVPTANEFVLLQKHFVAHGLQTIVCSPDELEYDGGKLRCGDFPIDLVYKRVVIHEFLAKYDETHPLVRAFLNRSVCLVNPFRCKIVHKKASFEILTDEARQNWFSVRQRNAIARSIPWTRRVAERRTTYNGNRVSLLDFIRSNRAKLVLKPNDDYGGRGVFFGPRLNEREWDNAIATALSSNYVVQEAIELSSENFPVFNQSGWRLEPMFVDTNPFLFSGKVCGAMVRLSHSPIVNVTSGGGETGFFVLDECRLRSRGAC
jgi:hypothetical protein